MSLKRSISGTSAEPSTAGASGVATSGRAFSADLARPLAAPALRAAQRIPPRCDLLPPLVPELATAEASSELVVAPSLDELKVALGRAAAQQDQSAQGIDPVLEQLDKLRARLDAQALAAHRPAPIAPASAFNLFRKP